MKTFEAWVKAARVTDDPVGDFVTDMRCDLASGNVPPITDKAGLRYHLRSHGACREAVATIPDVWKRYRRWAARSVR